jgi:hypothetical protein
MTNFSLSLEYKRKDNRESGCLSSSPQVQGHDIGINVHEAEFTVEFDCSRTIIIAGQLEVAHAHDSCPFDQLVADFSSVTSTQVIFIDHDIFESATAADQDVLLGQRSHGNDLTTGVRSVRVLVTNYTDLMFFNDAAKVGQTQGNLPGGQLAEQARDLA